MSYAPHKRDDCPLCEALGAPTTIMVPVKLVDTGEWTYMNMKIEKAIELGIIKHGDAVSRLADLSERH